MIESAKHPLMLIGAGANRKRFSASRGVFIEKTGIPFFTTQMGKGVIDDDGNEVGILTSVSSPFGMGYVKRGADVGRISAH